MNKGKTAKTKKKRQNWGYSKAERLLDGLPGNTDNG